MTIRDTVTERVAFLFTDIAASTELWETRPAAMRAALSRHDEILSGAIEGAGGRVFKHTGDGVLAAFPTVVAAVEAATESQRALGASDWGDLDLVVRMAVDAGEVEVRGGDYLRSRRSTGGRASWPAAHGGQILLSEGAQQALSAEPGVQLRNLGEHRLRGLGAPVRVFQLLAPDLPAEFPGLRLDAATAGLARQFGDVIRGYELRQPLGEGDFGLVYRAYQPTVGREVAVKVIRPEYANQAAFVRRFEREAQLVAQLEHPHIVPLFDYWRDPGGAYLVMPYLRGGSLAGALRHGGWNLAPALQLIDQVGGALAYAHRQGVVHRDVKPSNVLLDEEGNAYLSDFGIAARLTDDADTPLTTTLAFVPPEELRGEAHTARSDVFSLGVLSFQLVTGVVPPGASPCPRSPWLDPGCPPTSTGSLPAPTTIRPTASTRSRTCCGPSVRRLAATWWP